KAIREVAESGLRTGMVFFEYIRGQRPDLPVIVFSNVSDPEVGKTFAAKENCRFLQKIDVAPLDLVEEVCEMLGLKPGN
ncbi:MAG TPA: hypothetical protein PLG66_07840, partial [Calditrichia bacterium]|nr:hypothetical protein [Calditrichia bacterium]